MSQGNLITLSMLGYGLVVIYIGIRGVGGIKRGIDNDKTQTSEGYFVASRSFGWFIMVCSVTMSIFSGLAFYGSPAFLFREGFGTIAATGFFLTGLMYPVVGYKLWRIAREKNYITAADYLRERYYSNGYGNLVTVLQLTFIIPYMALQFVAIGNGISVSSNGATSYNLAVIAFAVFIGIYVYYGGAHGLGWLDIFNAIIGLIVPILVAVYIIYTKFDGSLSLMSQTALNNFPEMMDMPGPSNLFRPGNILGYMLAGNLVLIVAPHILPKLYMAKSKQTFKQMTIAGPLMYAWLGTGIFLLGTIGVALYKPTLANAESDVLMPKLVAENAPFIFVILLLWALFAFATSTSDAFGLSAASLISNDFVKRYGYKNIKDKDLLDRMSVKIGKLTFLFVLMPLMVVVAVLKPAYIVDYAYSFASPGFAQILPAILFGLYWKRATKEAAITGTILGLIVLAVTLFVVPWPLGVHPIIWSLGVNILSFWLITIFTKPPKEIVEEYHLKYDKDKSEVVGLD